MCWWCCMRVLEKCLPRNDIVRELAPYLQHVHQEDGNEDEATTNTGTNPVPPRPQRRQHLMTVDVVDPLSGTGDYVALDDKSSITSSDSFRNAPAPQNPPGLARSLTAVPNYNSSFGEALKTDSESSSRHNMGVHDSPNQHTASTVSSADHSTAPSSTSESHDALSSLSHHAQTVNSNSSLDTTDTDVQTSLNTQMNMHSTHEPAKSGVTSMPVKAPYNYSLFHHVSSVTHDNGDHLAARSGPKRRGKHRRTHSAPPAEAIAGGALLQEQPMKKVYSGKKVKTDLGDLTPVNWDKVVLVQVSVPDFRERMREAPQLMEDAKKVYEHTVLSRLTSEYGGQEVLSRSKEGLFVIAFASEFHAAKWCLSLQLSLVYAPWSEKLLKQFNDLKEVYIKGHGKSKKNFLLYRGFRVRMVIHAADSSIPPDRSLGEAVKWTQTVSEYAHGGQIVLSDSVWDRLKEQLVQLGNPVVEDLGCHAVLGLEVGLMLLLPRALECRRFPSLNSPHQLSLGMRDAPSAQRPVTMVFTFIEGARPLVRCHAEELAERIKTLCSIARELLRKHNGYECQELQGDFMLAFFHPVSAVLWCGEFQLRIRQKFREWNRTTEAKELMFSMAMGIETGTPASVSPHKTSGRADYFGNIVNQTARIAKAAAGGQVLLGSEAWNTFSDSPYRSHEIAEEDELFDEADSTIFQFKSHGYFMFKGISLPIGLVEAVPIDIIQAKVNRQLAGRGHTRPPKAKKLEDVHAKKTELEPVPSNMLKLNHGHVKSHDSIRETEYGEYADTTTSWNGEGIEMVEEVETDEESNSEPPLSMSLLATQAAGLDHAETPSKRFMNFLTGPSSPKAVATERMDRV